MLLELEMIRASYDGRGAVLRLTRLVLANVHHQLRGHFFVNLHDELAKVRSDLVAVTERYREGALSQVVPEGRRQQHEAELAALSKRIVMLSHSEQQLSEIVAPDTLSDQDSQFNEQQRHG